MNNKIQLTVFHTVHLNNKPTAIGVEYKPKKHIDIFNATVESNNKRVTAIILSPSFAHSLINNLNEQLEWYKNPLHQWARKKTSINKQIHFKR